MAPSLRTLTIYGGAPYGPQEGALRRGVDVVVATPGRTIDLLNHGSLDFSDVGILCLDEADMMLTLGMKEAVDEDLL